MAEIFIRARYLGQCGPDLVVREPRPPYLRIAEDLREKIICGALLPGEQVPSVSSLCQTYTVSRTTAMRALTVLRDEGLVTTTPRWGTFVADRS